MIYPVTIYNAGCEICKREFIDLDYHQPDTDLEFDHPLVFLKEEEIRISLVKNGWYVAEGKTYCGYCHRLDEGGVLVLIPNKPIKPAQRVRRRPSPDNEEAN